jgi:hypothetical protein
MTSYKSPKEALDAAANLSTGRDELLALARYDFVAVKKAVVNHPGADEEHLRLCFPNQIKSQQDNELILSILAHPKIPRDLLEKIGSFLEVGELGAGLYQVALEYYSREDVSLDDIQKFVVGRNANSKFRNELWKKTNRNKVKQLLDNIKNKNRIENVSVAQSPVEEKLSPVAPAKQSDSRLVGSWAWTDASLASSYGLMASVSVHETYGFLADGHFFRRVDSFASNSHAGLQQAFAQASPEDRGQWSTAFGKVILNWDDNMVSEINYFIVNETLELKLSKGPRYYLRN